MNLKPLNGEKLRAPFMPVKEGYGYLGTLMYDEIEDKLQCHLCGNLFSYLGFHLPTHKITTREYKKKFGLNLTTPLVIPSISDKLSQNAQKRLPGWMKNLTREQIHEIASRNSKKGNRKGRNGNKFTIEMMNRFGTCPAQIEERFIREIEELGHVPSWDELLKRNPSLLAVLQKRFKGYSKALIYFGYKPKRRVNMAKYEKKDIRKTIKKFIDDKKRLPNPHDTRMGALPHYDTVSKYFKGWMNAKIYAFNYLAKKYPDEALKYDMRYRLVNY